MRSSRVAAEAVAIGVILALSAAACGGEGGTRSGAGSAPAAPEASAAEQQAPPSIYPMDGAPPAGTVPATGVILAQEVNAGGETACVVLALKDGKLGEVGRFTYPANTAGQDPAHGFEPCDQRTSFDAGFASMVGVRSYQVSPGVDRHPVLLARNGQITDISGRGEEGVKGASQSNPTIEPGTGRVWMWRPNPSKGVGNPLQLLHSMNPDGSDARDESEAQPRREDRQARLMFVGQEFTFLGGKPVYVRTAQKTIATPDGQTAVFSDHGKFQVGPIGSLKTNPELPVSGAVTRIDPQVFLPADGGDAKFVATSGEKIVLCTIQGGQIVTSPLYEPTDNALKRGMTQTSFVAADDGSLYYTVRNGVPVDGARVGRVVRLKDGKASVVAVIARSTGTASPLTALSYVK